MALTKVTGAGLGTVDSADLDGAVTINESSADVNFRVESNGLTNALFVDAGNNAVGINTTNASSGRLLHIEGGDTTVGITLKDTAGSQFGINSDDGDLIFKSDTAGAERMRLDSSGQLCIGSTTPASGASRASITQADNQDCLSIENTHASFTDRVTILNAHRAANSGYQFLLAYSGDFADLEFNLRGDGNAFADGSFSGGGADYAEYFEWKDGNTSDEDRVGISVKLDGDKIVVSSDSDNASDIIGVISANPSITGDSAWNKWNEKYLKDDYGRYKLDGNGERTLNPNYDKEKTYIAREDRKEWDVVGLMGKLRIKKGQKTGANWIKMRDVSDTVEEWLVR